MKTTADAYVRVSRVGGRSGASFISTKVQRDMIERHAQAHQIQILEWHEDLDQSGGKMSRPAFDRMMARVEAQATGGVIVARLDRFGRSLVGSLAAIERIDAAGGTFASAADSFDTSTSTGRLLLNVMLSMGQWELDRIRDSWDVAGTSAIERGVHLTPTIPYGYDKGDDQRLVPNEAAPFVRKAFEMRAAGSPFQRIADWLNTEAPARYVKLPKPNKPAPARHRWTDRSVERMISQRVYLGVAFWGEHENAKAHPPLVTEDLWHAAQHRVQVHSRTRQSEDAALLHGIIRCAGCRFQMSRALNTSGGRKRQYYRCRVHRVSGDCEAPASVRADGDDGLEAYIERIVCEELDRRAATFTSVRDTTELATAHTEWEAATSAVEDMRQDTRARERLGARWLSWLEPLLDAEDAARERYHELLAMQGALVGGMTSDAYRARSRAERTKILAAMIEVVFVRSVGGSRGRYAVPLNHNRVRILWRGQGVDALPSANQLSAVIPFDWPEDDA